MNDVEQDLRELFERKAGSVGGVAPRLPEPVRKRGRRRQLGTALVGGLTAVAVVVGSVAALRAIEVGADRGPSPANDPWAGYEVFERTATVGNFTITSPSDWYLVDQWPWARTPETRLKLRAGGLLTPILLLSDTDRGLESSPCLRSSFPIRPGDAVMTLAFDNAHFAANFGAGGRAQWPVSFDSSSEPERPPCGPGTYVYFARGDIPYVAHFAFGDAVTDQKRQTLIDAFEGMQVDDTQEAFMEEPSPDVGAAYVIAGGENAAGPWTLELRSQTAPGYLANVQLELITAEGPGVVAGGPFSVNADEPIEQAGGDPVFGAVVKEATGVELRLEDGMPAIPSQIVPLPPSMPFDFDLFFGSNDADVQATAVAMSTDGVLAATTNPIATPTLTFLDEVEHQPSGQTWSPATTREGDLLVMPITFPDGATAELVFPTSLGLEQLNVYPDAYADLEGERSDCGWPVHATRADPREGWLKGEEPLDRYVTGDGRTFELWRGHRPYTMLLSRTGPWNVLVSCSSINEIEGSTAQWAELLTPQEAQDGLLILNTIPPLRLQLGDEGATVRLSNRDVIIDLSSGRARCDEGSPDMGTGDEVVQWCIEPDGVYLYAAATGRAGTGILDGLVTGLAIRSYRPAT